MIRYALIGCGRIARNHMIAAKNHELDIVALCDLKPEAIDVLLKASSMEDVTAPRYTDYREMIEKEKPELVAIATDSGEHGKIALYCIEKGIHVLIEKPVAMSMAEARAINEAAGKHRVKVGVCHQNRFNTAVQEMYKARRAGRFGKLSHGSVHVRWNRNQAYYDQAPWRGKWASDGGTLMNQCIHGIDLLLWMVGSQPVSVYGATRQQYHPYLEAEDVGLSVITFADGTIATIEGTVNVFPKNLEETLYLFGENGTVKLGGKATNSIDVWQFRDSTPEDEHLQGIQEVIGNVYGNGHTRLYGDMLDAIANDRAPLIPPHEGMKALEVILAIYKSQKTGAVIPLPLDDFASADMVGTFGKDE